MRTARKSALVSVDLMGGDRRVHVTSDNATEFEPSPDERYVAWVERFNAYVAPLPLTGKGVVNLAITKALYALLEKAGVPTHFVATLDERRMVSAPGKIQPPMFMTSGT